MAHESIEKILNLFNYQRKKKIPLYLVGWQKLRCLVMPSVGEDANDRSFWDIQTFWMNYDITSRRGQSRTKLTFGLWGVAGASAAKAAVGGAPPIKDKRRACCNSVPS